MGAVRLGARYLYVRGTVQGVGFRPFVYRLAVELGLCGWVRNNLGAVAIYVEGPEESLARFPKALLDRLPPLARVEELQIEDTVPIGCSSFVIAESSSEELGSQRVPPDVATCQDCLSELFDPADPRYLYPFINCTNCGPRFSIIQELPYDRLRTVMQVFSMCGFCRKQYDDPSDRRFHAQPIACPACGPHLSLLVGESVSQGNDYQCIDLAARLLKQGLVVAIKGLGGFHLAVDAENPEAVRRLRTRKVRPHKAFALMATLERIQQYCWLSPLAEELLTSPAAPIVLLPMKPAGERLSELVAPDGYSLGFMLPYTPLHHLLLHAFDGVLVMTSGNLSEEPLCYNNEEALERLSALADAFLLHNRPIYTPCDDSVVAIAQGVEHLAVPVMIRRARGYVPEPFDLRVDGPDVLAAGPELKATFCLARGQSAFLSQHIGDLGTKAAWEHYRRLLMRLEELLGIFPEVIAHDLHPDYATTRYALERAEREGLKVVGVQHHYAHALSCLAEHSWHPGAEPVLAVVFDGTGYGLDGKVWGGEWLLIDGAHWQRVAHLEYLPLAGGEAAIHNVDRLAAGYLLSLSGPDFGGLPRTLRHLTTEELELIRLSIKRADAIWTSSMGRLFDAVAGCLGVCRKISYEAQAAIKLEKLAVQCNGRSLHSYECITTGSLVGIGKLLQTICAEVEAGVPAHVIARRFHETVATVVGELCSQLAGLYGVRKVVLSGGCFQNMLLLGLCYRALQAKGLDTLVHSRVPPNDGGIALGQVLAARLKLA